MHAREMNSTAVQSTLIAAMAIWGLNVAAVKVLTGIFDPTTLAALRMLVACGALSMVVLWKRCGLPSVSVRQGGAIVVCALLMVYLNQILFAEGLMRSTATNGALIMALSPLVSALLAAVVFRERPTVSRLVGVALGFAGVAAVVLSHPGAGLSSAGAGDLMLVAAVVSFAAGGAIVQRLARHMHTLTISWAIYLVGALLLTLHAGIEAPALDSATLFPGWRPWAFILFSGVLATALSNLVWNRDRANRCSAHRRFSLLGSGIRRRLRGFASRRATDPLAPLRLPRSDGRHLSGHTSAGGCGGHLSMIRKSSP